MLLRKGASSVQSHPCVPPVAHPYVVFSIWGDNLLIEFTCQSGFELFGDSFGSCNTETGNWTVESPRCLSDGCTQNFNLNNGFVNFEENGKIASFLCDRGHYLVGKETIYCYGKNWSDPIPKCSGASDHSLFGKKVMLKNDTVAPSTNKSDVIDFDAEILKTDTTCYRYRKKSKPPAVEHADVKTKYVYNKYRRMWVIIANYTCHDGYQFPSNGSRYLFCQGYEWKSPVTPVCVKIPVHPCEDRNAGCSQLCIPGEDNFYHCDCSPGFSLDTDGHTCVDRNECLINNGGCEQLCRNTHGSRYCLCRAGYAAIGNLCFDLDECQDPRKNTCQANCINTPGSFRCNCSIPGYRSQKRGPYCEDLDECANKKGGCQGICQNVPGSYRCKCRRGFQLAADKHMCTDIDECARYGKRACKHGDCFNRYGSYMCACHPGYTQHRNRIHCIDLNECKIIPNGGCEDKCVNTLGSYKCECNRPGVVLEKKGKICLDIDECEVDNGGCEEVCTNYWGDHECSCNMTGHVLHENKRNCTVCPIHQYINERDKICVDCPPFSGSVNTSGIADSYRDCHCLPGFLGNPSHNVTCKDIDECETNNFGCQDICNNTEGSAFCSCFHGYRLSDDNKSCMDIDECLTDNGGCNYTCHNTDGTFHCNCPDGYELDFDKKTCLDLDECWLDVHNCTHLCINTEGGVQCNCPGGFILQDDGRTCLDFDECSQPGAYYCEDKCVNTEGSYRCECPHPGYKLSWDGASCSDLNECMEGENNCRDACINVLGSYQCGCSGEGYTLSTDGVSCEDVDECLSADLNRCEHGCDNIEGGYICTCDAGYINAGYFNCKECPENMYREVTSKVCVPCPDHSLTNGTGKGSRLDCICQLGYHGNFNETDQCIDDDECANDNFGCEQMCYNTHGSAHCGCYDGYTMDNNNKNCSDIDECLYTRHCVDKCINMPGTYRCGCRDGFRIHNDGRYCTDIDECYEERPCAESCQNTWGSYHCQCLQWGYSLADDGHTCVVTNRKVRCPKDIFVEIPPNANSTKVTLPSYIWSRDWKISPDWVKAGALFPIGFTTVALLLANTTRNDSLCSFKVNVVATCGFGTYKLPFSTPPCGLCPMGQYQNEIDRSECKKCHTGTYQNLTGQSECKYCNPGSFQNHTGQSYCHLCPPGSYQDLIGQLKCKTCIIGTFQNRSGQPQCSFCSPGSYQNTTGQSECVLCPVGSYQTFSGQSQCSLCPAGTFQESVGQIGCMYCPVGTFQDDVGQITCKECPYGTFQEFAGQSICKPCNASDIELTAEIKDQCQNKT